MKGQTKKILVVVVKSRHRANGLLKVLVYRSVASANPENTTVLKSHLSARKFPVVTSCPSQNLQFLTRFRDTHFQRDYPSPKPTFTLTSHLGQNVFSLTCDMQFHIHFSVLGRLYNLFLLLYLTDRMMNYHYFKVVRKEELRKFHAKLKCCSLWTVKINGCLLASYNYSVRHLRAIYTTSIIHSK